MRAAWMLGVFLYLPQPGHAVPRRPDSQALPPLPAAGSIPSGSAFFLGSGGLPEISGFLLDRAGRAALPGFAADQERPSRTRFLGMPGWSQPAAPPRRRAPVAAPAPDSPDPAPEFEPLGEDMRDAVASRPSLGWFLQALRDADPKKRGAAVEAFGYPNNLSAIPYVSAVLLRVDEDVSVRVAAAETLGRIGDRRAWRFLAQAVTDLDDRVRFAAVLGLGELRSYGDAHLEKVLALDRSWWVRYAAAATLGRARKPWSAGWLGRAACADAAWPVRFQAALALGEMGTPPAAAALARPLRDPEPLVRTAAALALSRVSGGANALLLSQALRRETDADVRAALYWALERAKARGF